ncbi:MAG: hypothetical protein ACKVOE_02335 [Rickettsiales bacterium]
MSSKNNPEMRGEVTQLRKYKDKVVKPCRIINREEGLDILGAAYENGEIVIDAVTKRAIPYSEIYG